MIRILDKWTIPAVVATGACFGYLGSGASPVSFFLVSLIYVAGQILWSFSRGAHRGFGKHLKDAEIQVVFVLLCLVLLFASMFLMLLCCWTLGAALRIGPPDPSAHAWHRNTALCGGVVAAVAVFFGTLRAGTGPLNTTIFLCAVGAVIAEAFGPRALWVFKALQITCLTAMVTWMALLACQLVRSIRAVPCDESAAVGPPAAGGAGA